jgi:RND superfamily putative drug exporter
VLVDFELAGDAEDNRRAVVAPMAAVEAAARAHPEVRVAEVGEASLTKALEESGDASEQRAELFSYASTFVILLVAFGALVAAGLPLLLGLTAVIATLGLLAPVSRINALSDEVSIVVTLIGLAVGVDYAMFYLRRHMEERDRGASPEVALDTAAATSGRAVLISALTVIIAMAGMFIAGNPIFTAFGIGTMLVVAVALVGSLTFLPAMLAFLSRKNWTEKGRVPFIARRRHARRGESRAWGAIVHAVMRRPLLWALLSGGALVALSIPALGMHLKDAGTDGFARSIPIMRSYDRLQEAFPGGVLPAVVVVKADDVTRPEVRAAVAELHDRALATGRLAEPTDVAVSPDRTVAQVLLSPRGSGTDRASGRAIDVLRTEVVPQTVGRLQGAEVAVTGMTAQSKDFLDVMERRLPFVFAFVLSLAFLLLLVTFRSIVVPLKAIVLNLLSVGAAYGVLVLLFQDGHGERALDFESVGGITPWLPLFLFVVLFGLSMDYHVFILSRVREAVLSGMSTEHAVAHGIRRTAGVVTSAAAVMVAVFASFALSEDQPTKQLAVGLAAAILIDATIVRAILLPATMKLLGARNWYLPRSLRWLPRVEHQPEPEPVPA